MEVPTTITGPIDGAIDFVYSLGTFFEHTVVLGKILNSRKKMHLSSLTRTIHLILIITTKNSI